MAVAITGVDGNLTVTDQSGTSTGEVAPTLGTYSSAAAGAIGGERDITSWVQETFTGSPTVVQNDIDANLFGSGTYRHTQQTDNIGHGWTQWDGVDGAAWALNAPQHNGLDNLNTSGLGGVDVTDGGVSNSVYVDLIATDQPMTEVILAFYLNGTTDYVEYSFILDPTMNGDRVTMYMSDGTLNAGGGVTIEDVMTNVGAIWMHTHGLEQFDTINHQALDLSLNEIGTTNVPVPTSAALIMGGLGILGAAARKRNKS